MPMKHKNSIINNRGMRLLEDLCPDHWILNPPVEDYGWDYHVDLTTSDGVTSGKSFYIQLKSHLSMKFSTDDFFSESIDREHLRDWEARNLPMFLCCADLQNQEIYWCFIQKYLADNPHWHSSDNLSIKIPKKNKLSDIPLFFNAINEAILYIGSFKRAEQSTVAEYKRKDPNFDYQVDYINGQQNIRIISYKEHPFSLNLTGEKKEVENFFSGEVACLQINNSSSGLYEIGQRVKLQAGEKERISASIILLNKNRREMGRLDGLDGTLFSILHYLDIHVEHPSKLLSLKIKDENTPSQFTFCFSAWEGKSIFDFAYIDFFYEFFCKSEGLTMELAISLKGKEYRLPFGLDCETDSFKKIRQMLENQKLIYDAATLLNYNIPYSELITANYDEIINTCKFLTCGKLTMICGESLKIKFTTFNKPDKEKLLQKPPAPLRINSCKHEVMFFGKKLLLTFSATYSYTKINKIIGCRVYVTGTAKTTERRKLLDYALVD